MEENKKESKLTVKKENHKKSKFSKKHKIIIIITSCIIGILIIGIIIFLLFENKNDDNNRNTKKVDADTKMSLKEFKAIVDAYGDAVKAASDNYISLNNGKIPEFKEIKDSVIFDKHKVDCSTNKINYDGSVYLKGCKVDGKSILDEYAYGEEKNQPSKSGDKIYLYKKENIQDGNDKNTGIVYRNKTYFVFNDVNNTDGFTLLDTYECETKECKGYDYSDKNNKIIIFDGNYYLYDINSKNKQEINIEKIEYNDISYVENSKKVYGISLRKKGKNYDTGVAFFSIESNNTITDYKYGQLYALDSVGYVLASSNTGTDLINYINGNVEKTIAGLASINEIYINGVAYYYASVVSEGPNYASVVLNNNLDRIVSFDDYNGVFNTDATITVQKNNDKHFYIYDLNGNLIRTSNEYKQVLKIVKDFVIVLTNDDDLVLLNKNDELLTTFLHVTDKHYLHPLISGWYTTNGKHGIYFVVGDNDIPYGTMGSGLEYYYIPETGETGVIKTEGVGGYAKPVLYLYPKKKAKVTVTFEHPELLTTTYPKFNKKWKVTANKNGDLYDSNGKYYYGLYWEEEGSNAVDFKEGFYVDKDSAIEFLEEKLTKIGLNKREKNEFIMYWLPIIEKNEHNLIYFELTEGREKYNKLNIKPKPDSLLRVAIHVKKVDGKTDIKEQKLKRFKRKGFAAVEWGGVIHK